MTDDHTPVRALLSAEGDWLVEFDFNAKALFSAEGMALELTRAVAGASIKTTSRAADSLRERLPVGREERFHEIDHRREKLQDDLRALAGMSPPELRAVGSERDVLVRGVGAQPAAVTIHRDFYRNVSLPALADAVSEALNAFSMSAGDVEQPHE